MFSEEKERHRRKRTEIGFSYDSTPGTSSTVKEEEDDLRPYEVPEGLKLPVGITMVRMCLGKYCVSARHHETECSDRKDGPVRGSAGTPNGDRHSSQAEEQHGAGVCFGWV